MMLSRRLEEQLCNCRPCFRWNSPSTSSSYSSSSFSSSLSPSCLSAASSWSILERQLSSQYIGSMRSRDRRQSAIYAWTSSTHSPKPDSLVFVYAALPTQSLPPSLPHLPPPPPPPCPRPSVSTISHSSAHLLLCFLLLCFLLCLLLLSLLLLLLLCLCPLQPLHLLVFPFFLLLLRLL